MADAIKTLCPYCGVGCGLEVLPPARSGQATQRDATGAPMWKVRGDRAHPSSQGMICVKGATVTEAMDRDRLKYPMMRDSLDQPFQRVSWDEVLDRIVQRIQAVRDADAICMYGSGQSLTEDYYVAQKLLKGCLGTNNFDSNSRLCMASAATAYTQSFGSDGPPCCYEDLELTDCAFLIGTNAAECHPIVFNRLHKHCKKHAHVKLIVVDPRRTQTAEAADLHLAIRPGTDIDLLNGIAYLLMQWGAIDNEFINDCTENFSAFATVVQHYPPDLVAQRCGIPVAELETAARYWSQSKRVLSLWLLGLNQSIEGTAKIRTLINLHLMTGQVGQPGAGPFSLTGQPNAMGGREVGGSATQLPGYRFVNNPVHRAEVERFWQLPPGRISPRHGRTAWEIITGLEAGEVEVLWIAATNPAVSLPDLARSHAALRRSPFTIYQEAYYPTETAAFAHVLLPAAPWGEKTGTMTNSERVVTLCSAFRSPIGEARPDWKIFAEVGRRLGFADQFPYTDAAEVYAEFVQFTRGRPCDMSSISHDRLRHQGPVQWGNSDRNVELGMMNDELADSIQNSKSKAQHSPRLYTDRRFPTPTGRARFAAYHARGLAEPPDEAYPFVLITGRVYGHWHTQTRTGRIEKLRQMYPQPWLEVHPIDAKHFGVQTGDLVEVRSRRGMAQFPVRVTEAIAPRTLFVPMHWGALWADGGEANALTHADACPDSLQPELKTCAVQLLRVPTEPLAVELRPVASAQAGTSSSLSPELSSSKTHR
ncbi:nitrate reductase [Leptolyngbya sp. FACHB-36]|uniref:molybdopterin oxidoreductase family protein n=1 Tax=Leptolyngbya sp. FACHB-36 TaxID=2692808 RepID=UPI0016816205|nr:nitrate reductase [Leptolyngbya sp. FACHB-36]MBD2021993.1 nitrate reductase [Leptolyngbya sp. FACHB-36]